MGKRKNTVKSTPDIDQVNLAASSLDAAMRDVDSAINRFATHAGILEALIDNRNQVETLSSPRAEKTFQLISALAAARDDLADHLRSAFQ